MSLTITRQGDPLDIKTVTGLILGNPGAGKTTLACTTANALLLDFDRGSHRAANRPDTVLIDRWADIEGIRRDDLTPYSTLVVDTVGRCLDTLIVDIIEKEPAAGYGGTLKLQGYGRLKSRFTGWMKQILSYGLNVILVAHALEERHGEEVKLRVDGAGSGKEEVYKIADMIGRLTVKGGNRVIDWNPSDSGFGKNPGRLPAAQVPDSHSNPLFLQQAIETTLAAINSANRASNDEAARQTDLRAELESLKTTDEFNARAAQMKSDNAKPVDRGMLVAIAKERGFEFDKSTATFTESGW